LRKRRIIVFDDEELIVKLLEEYLSSIGYEVFAYTTPVICPVYGENAEVCIRPCADVIITDQKMPRMSGLELLQEQNGRGCRLPIKNKALISGFIDDERQRLVKEVGCAFFQKPFYFTELQAWLADCETRMDLTLPLFIRRKEKRYPISLEINYSLHDNRRLLEGVAVNISNTGLGLKHKNLLVKNQKVLLHTPLPVASNSATVCWTSALDDGSYLAGLNCS